MADLVISGMEMPKAATVIAIHKLNGKFYVNVHGVGLCPILPLPEGHGRLVDADAVTQEAYRRLLECEKYGNEFEKPYEVIRAIETAKTIVPAEGGTDDG